MDENYFLKNIINKKPKLAKELLTLWTDWNTDNVEMRNPVYADYYRARDAFFESTIPEKAKAEGYKPKFKKMFPNK